MRRKNDRGFHKPIIIIIIVISVYMFFSPLFMLFHLTTV